MMNETLTSDLTMADPAGDDDAQLRDLVARMAIAARDVVTSETPAPTRWWKRRRVTVPLGIASVAALTGGALLIPLGLSINGTRVEADTQIPIVYTTDTGRAVSCRVSIYFGEPGNRSATDREVARFMGDHNWTGIGQRIYEEAIAHPFVPGRDGGMENDTSQGRDEMSLSRATDVLIEAAMPGPLREALLKESNPYQSVTDCKGELH